MLKSVLFIAFIGHVLCGICDCLLSYSPGGRLDLKGSLKDPDKMRTVFAYMPLSWPLISILLGVYAIISIVVHHIICGLVEWLFIRMGRTNEARQAVLEFQAKTIVTMVIGYLGLASFVITLFIMVSMGKTTLPQWACVLNTLPVMLILLITRLPAKGNIAGAIMYLGLFILL